MDFLTTTVILLAIIVLLGFFNEKVTHITYEISLMLFSIVIGVGIFIVLLLLNDKRDAAQLLSDINLINIEDFLMKGVLCFMLFAGSCHMKLLDFKKHARAITLLSLLATFLGSLFYGFLFYGVSLLLHLPLSLPVCLMFGSITAPTDPIAATSILKKFNLPPGVGFIIEGESLLNDGVGVALFVCFSGMAAATGADGGGFFMTLGKEIFGAILVGIVATAICFPIFRFTKDTPRKIFVSLLAVALAYVACEKFGFSSAIASVVCGVLFSALRNYYTSKGDTTDLTDFDSFWGIIDNLLNSILYVMLGLSFIPILQIQHVIIISVCAIVINLIGRSASVAVSSLMIGKLPDGYDRINFIKLLTWGGLRGGLCVALAMSTSSLVEPSVYPIILGGTYAIVFFTTVIQGLTMPRVYKGISASVSRGVIGDANH